MSDFTTWLVSREDLIVLPKLLWARAAESALQLRDVRTLLAVPFDEAYVNEWIRRLGLESTLHAART